MMAVWEFKDLENMPVVSMVAAREIGHVQEVLFNPAANALYGLVVKPSEKDGPLLLVPQRGIRAIGKDAITIENLGVAERFDDNVMAQEISAADGHRNGMNVMTQSGESVGKVDKVTINNDGTVASYHSTTGLFGTKHELDPAEIVSGSKDMLIIADTARENWTKPAKAD